MSAYQYKNGIGHVGSYQSSAKPYLSSSLTIPASGSAPMQISFVNVSRFIIIKNTLSVLATNIPLRFGFSDAGVRGTTTNNYIILNNGESFEAEYRVTNLFLLSDTSSQCSASIAVGLTTIAASELPDNWSGSAGVG